MREGLVHVHAGEDIVPAGRSRGGVNVVVNVNVEGGEPEAIVNTATAVFRAEMMAALVHDKRTRDAVAAGQRGALNR